MKKLIEKIKSNFYAQFNFIEAIVIAILGITITAAALITEAGWQIVLLGAIIAVAGIAGIIINNPKNDDKE